MEPESIQQPVKTKAALMLSVECQEDLHKSVRLKITSSSYIFHSLVVVLSSEVLLRRWSLGEEFVGLIGTGVDEESDLTAGLWARFIQGPWWSWCLPTYRPSLTHLFFPCLQSPHTLETRVRQLHDRRNSRTAVRRNHVRVQHRGGQHEEETKRGLFCPQPEPNPLHHHLISTVPSTTLVYLFGYWL